MVVERCRLTPRWSPPLREAPPLGGIFDRSRPARCRVQRDTSPWLAGRLISRPLGGYTAPLHP